MKRLIPLIIMIVLCISSSAQNWDDALRYSESFAGGTARPTAMAGAYGALGADFYSATQNPAGLGFFRSSEIMFSPEIQYSTVNSTYYGTTKNEFKHNLNVNNFAYVGSYSKKADKGFIGGTFAFGYNKLRNFSDNIIIEGVNNASSLADVFAASANEGTGSGPVVPSDLLPFSEGLFYDGYLMDYDTIETAYLVNGDMLLPDLQRNTVSRSGKINEWIFSAGFNIGHIFYFGSTFSILPVRYKENSVYSEFDANDADYKYFSYNEDLSISGTGYTGKFGIIVKPVPFLRIGTAFHLPVFYVMSEVYSATLRSRYYSDFATIFPQDGNGYIVDDSRYEYDVVTPYKLVGSVATTIGKIAALDLDVEFIDYTTMRLRNGDDGYDFYDENEAIKEIYKSTLNLKFGGEIRLNNLYLRAGTGYYGSPYKNSEINSDAYHLMLTGGIGYRIEHFYIDMALSHTMFDEKWNLYTFNTQNNIVSMEHSTTRILTTIGFKF